MEVIDYDASFDLKTFTEEEFEEYLNKKRKLNLVDFFNSDKFKIGLLIILKTEQYILDDIIYHRPALTKFCKKLEIIEKDAVVIRLVSDNERVNDLFIPHLPDDMNDYQLEKLEDAIKVLKEVLKNNIPPFLAKVIEATELKIEAKKEEKLEQTSEEQIEKKAGIRR